MTHLVGTRRRDRAPPRPKSRKQTFAATSSTPEDVGTPAAASCRRTARRRRRPGRWRGDECAPPTRPSPPRGRGRGRRPSPRFVHGATRSARHRAAHDARRRVPAACGASSDVFFFLPLFPLDGSIFFLWATPCAIHHPRPGTADPSGTATARRRSKARDLSCTGHVAPEPTVSVFINALADSMPECDRTCGRGSPRRPRSAAPPTEVRLQAYCAQRSCSAAGSTTCRRTPTSCVSVCRSRTYRAGRSRWRRPRSSTAWRCHANVVAHNLRTGLDVRADGTDLQTRRDAPIAVDRLGAHRRRAHHSELRVDERRGAGLVPTTRHRRCA